MRYRTPSLTPFNPVYKAKNLADLNRKPRNRSHEGTQTGT